MNQEPLESEFDGTFRRRKLGNSFSVFDGKTISFWWFIKYLMFGSSRQANILKFPFRETVETHTTFFYDHHDNCSAKI